MRFFKNKFSQLFQFISAYGIVGIFRFLSYNAQQVVGERGDLYNVRLPGGTIAQLRRRTTDLSTLYQVWIGEHYNLKTLPCWEFFETRYRAILGKGRTPLIIDGGANIGLSMLYFHKLFPEAQIIGVEPDGSNVALARSNTASRERLSVRQLALYGAPGKMTIADSDPHHKDAFQVVPGEADGSQVVEATTVDLLAASAAEDCDLFLVKMDIEGGEAEALYGATQAQTDGVPFIIEPHDWLPNVSGSLCGLETLFCQWNFDFFMRLENIYLVPRKRKAVSSN